MQYCLKIKNELFNNSTKRALEIQSWNIYNFCDELWYAF